MILWVTDRPSNCICFYSTLFDPINWNLQANQTACWLQVPFSSVRNHSREVMRRSRKWPFNPREQLPSLKAFHFFLLAVFICTHLKRTSCNIYLAALATSDTAFLLCVFLSWSADIYNRNGWCQTLIYLTYVTSFLSVWYIVAFTTERFILVCFPSKRHKVCTPQVAQVIVIVLTIFAFAFYSFSPIVSGILSFHGHTICAPLPDYIQVSWILNNLDTLLTLVIPVIIILGCNIRIARLVCSFYKTKPPKPYHYVCKWEFTGQSQNNNYQPNVYMRRSYSSVSTTGIHSTILPPSSKSGSNYQIRATRMLLIVSTVFLVCNLPTHAVRCYGFVMNMIDDSYVPGRSFILWQKFFQILYYINFSVNFFLYSFSSRSFRLGFRRLRVKAKTRLKPLCRKRETPRSPDRVPRPMQNLPSPHVPLKEAEITTWSILFHSWSLLVQAANSAKLSQWSK